MFADFDSYFWPGQSALRNKLGIHNEIELETMACKYATVGLMDLAESTLPDVFDAEYLKHVHKVLLGDVYEWAGKYRACPMSRNQDYCDPENIPTAIDKFCETFKSDFLDKRFNDKSETADALAKAWADLNSIHPFRDGNGRSQFVFFNKACEAKGYELVPSKQDLKNLRAARDSASMGRTGLLSDMLSRSLREIDGFEKAEMSRLIVNSETESVQEPEIKSVLRPKPGIFGRLTSTLGTITGHVSGYNRPDGPSD